MIDLHCHSNISDGSMSLFELISLAKEKGITHLAITDHDTTKGLKEAKYIGEQLGVTIIPGIEISAYDYKRQRRAHILGFFVEPHHEAIENLCSPLLKMRHLASYEMTKRIMKAGFNISWEEVEQLAKDGTGAYKQHIMHALINKGYADKIYGDLYDKLFSKGGEGKPQGLAHIPIQYVDVEDAIVAIREAGGLPVLAHPKQFNNFDAIPEWVEIGLEGIEAVHPLHGPKDEELVKYYADQFELIETGGSDFHGFYGNFELGSKDAGMVRYEKLLERYQKMCESKKTLS
ncbi:PHP domain-containing protein [Aeribacillus pallidus]|uniref:Phosphatase n=1 Tax=Aeribacillus pallidus TaxID=33936 RepID=A0A164ACR2_9BACI|nr:MULTISPECIES: PHP domain-containing protein [Aeribacillus]KZM56044.1 phosphatase [Aeribacillus pallidus]KZN96436.1 phosphatase [Aeribacillus pallidus]MDR9791400.1 PHP domain-containing protein [Aeribacillus pallidus]MED0650767.1 PHP domain-containing protein [Aeribacillus composti]MED4487932.1 PHP domain-containing protein [Aeribacillus pallidus]